MATVEEIDSLLEADPDIKAAFKRGEVEKVRELARRMYESSGLIGESPPKLEAAPALTLAPERPKEHGLFPSLDPLSKYKLMGADLVNRGITDVLSYGDTGPMPGTAAPRPEGDLPLVPRHVQDVVEFAGLGRAGRGIVEFGKGVKKGLQTGPETTLRVNPPVGTGRPQIVEPGVSQAPKTAPFVSEGDANLIREVTEGRLTPQSAEYISDMVREEVLSGRFAWNVERPAMENIADVITRRVPGQEGQDLASYYRRMTSESGKVFQKYAQLTKEMLHLQTEFAPLPDSGFMRGWMRTTNVIKGLYVSQLATAVRNSLVGAGRVGLDVIQAPLDTSIQKIFNLPDRARDADGLIEVWRVAQQLHPRYRKEIRDLIHQYPVNERRVFGTYSSDVLSRAGVEKGFPEKLTDLVNWENRFQEFTFRGGVLQARLEQRLRFKGRSLQQIMAEGRGGAIDTDDIKYAGEQALELTFAAQPKYGGTAHKFIEFVNSPTPVQTMIWFPRFAVNSAKFLFEYNPTGILRYLSARERAELASGNTQGVSRAIIGAIGLDAAFQYRNSDLAGSKWYLGKLPVDVPGIGKAGEEVDMRPFNPGAAYLFVADVIKRKKDGTLRNMDGKEIVAGVLSVNLRAGTAGYTLDALMRNFGGDPQEVTENLHQWAGESVSGLLNPLGQFVDMYDDFTKNEQVQRDIKDQPFLGPLKKKIPGAQADMPEYVSPTHRGPTVISQPAARQFTGMRKVPEKNAAEVEYERLGFATGDVYRTNPDHRIDRIRRTFSAALFEDVMVPFVQHPGYTEGIPRVAKEQAIQEAQKQKIPPEQRPAFVKEQQVKLANILKAYAFSQELARVHAGVSTLTNLVLTPEDQAVKAIQKLPQDLKRYLREFNVTPKTLRESGLR